MNFQTILNHFTKVQVFEVGVALVLFCLSLLLPLIPPHQMEIPLERNNPLTLYKNTTETVPFILCSLLAWGIPSLFVAWFGYKRSSTRYIITVYITFFFSISVTEFITNSFKLFAGRPRPNYWELYDAGYTYNAYKSFPSGHSSTIFNGMSFLAILIAGELKVFSGNGSLIKLCISALPFVAAGLVALTRTRDYFHHFDDILAGGLIGSVVSIVCYLIKFKPLWGTEAGEVEGEDNMEFDNEYVV
ncbi:Phosphatidic acid phosphatase type 2 domain-containing protein 1B [Entamoeba marina]